MTKDSSVAEVTFKYVEGEAGGFLQESLNILDIIDEP